MTYSVSKQRGRWADAAERAIADLRLARCLVSGSSSKSQWTSTSSVIRHVILVDPSSPLSLIEGLGSDQETANLGNLNWGMARAREKNRAIVVGLLKGLTP